MKPILKFTLTLLFFLLPLSLVAEPSQAEAGKKTFEIHCQSCHGPGAQGQKPTQPMGGMDEKGQYIAPALNGTGHAWHHPNALLFSIIKNGSPAADSPMKGFKDRLSNRQILEVMAYFQSLWPEKIKTMHSQR